MQNDGGGPAHGLFRAETRHPWLPTDPFHRNPLSKFTGGRARVAPWPRVDSPLDRPGPSRCGPFGVRRDRRAPGRAFMAAAAAPHGAAPPEPQLAANPARIQRRRRLRPFQTDDEEAAAWSIRPPARSTRGGPGLGWSRLVSLILALLLVAAARVGAQDSGNVTDSSSSVVDGEKAWTSGEGGESVSGNKTTTLSHKRVAPETDPAYLAKAQTIRDKEGRDPVVVLNGLGGAGLQFRLRGAQPTHFYCRTWYARWHTAWILPRVILPPVARCLVDFITPVFDNATQTFRSKKGVEVQVKGFGQIVSLENLGPSLLPLKNFDYIRGFVKFMMTELHYTPGLDLFAAPYDWRYSPDVLKAQGYFTQLKALVESAYVSSGNRRVHLIGHSLGGVVSLAFLNDMDHAWKRKYIKSYIPVGAPFGGTLMNLLGSVSGYNLGIPINPADLRDFEALSPTGPWLFPRPCLWGPDEVLVQTPARNYTSGDYKCLLKDLGLHDSVQIYRHVFPQYLATLVPPGIDVHVVHSVGQPTVAALVYNETFTGDQADVPKPPQYIYGPGDGTVPERSLLRPLYEWEGRWGPQAGWLLTHHTFTEVDHMDSMNYRPFFRVLTDILSDSVEHTPRPDAEAVTKPPDWGWVMRKKFEAWDPLEMAWDAAEKAVEGGWPSWV